MAAKILPDIQAPQITESPVDDFRRVEGVKLDRLNLTLGSLAQTGEFPDDPLYEKVKDLAYEATHDPLTGLLNRPGFERKYKEVMAASETNPNAKYALIFLDLDGFKTINDTEGHEAGDSLLERVAKNWAESARFRANDVVARLGGDEFVVLADISHGEDKNEDENRHEHNDEISIQGIIAHAKEDALRAGKSLELDFKGASAGYAVCAPDKGLAELTAEADTKMYEDKKARNAGH